MLIPTPPIRKSRRVKAKVPATTPLVLVSGVYNSAASVVLTFDRPIAISALSGAAFVVNDNVDVGEKFEGSGTGSLLSPTTVEIAIVPAGGPSGSGITLTASAANGIVAVDGGTWAGVTDFALSTP